MTLLLTCSTYIELNGTIQKIRKLAHQTSDFTNLQVRYDNSCYTKDMMKTPAVFTLLNLIIIPISARIAQPGHFYGSGALLDGYCHEAQHFIDVFTLPSERLSDISDPCVHVHVRTLNYVVIMTKNVAHALNGQLHVP